MVSLLKRQGIIYYTAKTSDKHPQYYSASFDLTLSIAIARPFFPLTEKMASQLRIPFIVTCHGLGLSHPKYLQALNKAARSIL